VLFHWALCCGVIHNKINQSLNTQFTATPIVSGPESGHTKHLFHREKIPQRWNPFIWGRGS